MASVHEYLKPEVIWLVIGITLLIIEFSAPGLIVFFFGVGACLVATLCLFFDLTLNIQLLLFLLSSVTLLFSLRRWMKTIFRGRVSSSAEFDDTVSDFIGRKAIVKNKITPGLTGTVELNGTHWKAESTETIEKGKSVEIIGKKNITLLVKSL